MSQDGVLRFISIYVNEFLNEFKKIPKEIPEKLNEGILGVIPEGIPKEIHGASPVEISKGILAEISKESWSNQVRSKEGDPLNTLEELLKKSQEKSLREF